MKIQINEHEYSIEDAYELLDCEDSQSEVIEQFDESEVFDSYGNYIFPTETKFSGSNNLVCSYENIT